MLQMHKCSLIAFKKLSSSVACLFVGQIAAGRRPSTRQICNKHNHRQMPKLREGFTIRSKSLANAKRPCDCSVVWLMNIQHSVNDQNCAREVIVARGGLQRVLLGRLATP